jgi:hypothetical protein
VNHPIPQRKARAAGIGPAKGWDGRRAAPYAGPDPFELSRQRAEEEAATERRSNHETEHPVTP